MKPLKGDIVYCKKDYYYYDYSNNAFLINKKGKTYKIVDTSYAYYKYIVFVEIEPNIIKDSGFDFDFNMHGYYLDITNDNPTIVMSKHWKNYYDHFLTLQEYRKLKLEKLNNI